MPNSFASLKRTHLCFVLYPYDQIQCNGQFFPQVKNGPDRSFSDEKTDPIRQFIFPGERFD